MALTSRNYFKTKIKISIVNESSQKIGGGWSFISNLKKGLSPEDVEWVDWSAADLVLIPSASMIKKDLFREIKSKGKKTILRVDNALRNSRNRNTGMTRMREFARKSEAVVYQSSWSKDYLKPFLEKDGKVIHNGIDLNVFKPGGIFKDFKGKPVYLYSRFNRDETKGWIKVWYRYQYLQREQPEAKLVLIGRFANDIRNGNFDFFNNENFEYYGIAHSPEEMARVYRGCDYLFAPYYMDCFSNTYIEALACGKKLFEPDLSGGTPEIIKLFKEKGRDYFNCKRMAKEYLELFKGVVNRG